MSAELGNAGGMIKDAHLEALCVERVNVRGIIKDCSLGCEEDKEKFRTKVRGSYATEIMLVLV